MPSLKTWRRIAFFLLGLMLFLIGAWAVGWIPTNTQYCEYNAYRDHEKCTTYQVAIVVIRYIGWFLDVSAPALTAIATAFVGFFTFVLFKATVGLQAATNKLASDAKITADRQAADTRILRRAYVSVEPDGLHPMTQGLACLPTVEFRNAGNLPARNIRWAIHNALDFDDRRPKEKLAITLDLQGENTLPPGSRMTQGAFAPLPMAHNTESLRPQVGLYVYVWGLVRYDDGFGKDQSTYFCHRYNCINLRNVNRDASAPGAFRYDAPAKIEKEYGRYHRYGNDAT